MFLVSACSCLCAMHWSQVLSGEWRCNWSSADRRCFNYIWVINIFINLLKCTYIRDLRYVKLCRHPLISTTIPTSSVNPIEWDTDSTLISKWIWRKVFRDHFHNGNSYILMTLFFRNSMKNKWNELLGYMPLLCQVQLNGARRWGDTCSWHGCMGSVGLNRTTWWSVVQSVTAALRKFPHEKQKFEMQDSSWPRNSDWWP